MQPLKMLNMVHHIVLSNQKNTGFSFCIFGESFLDASNPTKTERGVSFLTLIHMNTNLITLQAVCHANHAITKFSTRIDGALWKEFGCFSVTGFCRCCDPCWHGSFESEGDQRWCVHLPGSVTFKPAGNIFINSWLLFQHTVDQTFY